MHHKTVLLREAVQGLHLTPSATVIDATYGSGGHAREVLKYLNEQGTYIGIDIDPTALQGQVHNTSAHVHLVNDNFRNITNILRSLHITEVDGVLADLGWRMEQFSDGERGLSFLKDEPLLMTLGTPEDADFTARDIINDWSEETIADILYGYADERFARRIARAIVSQRKIKPFETTFDLNEVVSKAIPKRLQSPRIHPATKTYQALRIAVNDELSALEQFLTDAFVHLKPGGYLSIITFHSIEDRTVKHIFKRLVESGVARLEPKRPLVPTSEEILANPRARSAKLRILTKLTVEEQAT